MSTESTGENPQVTEEPTIDDTLSAAFDAAEGGETVDTPLEAGGDEAPPDGTQIEDGRPRDERGRFVSASDNGEAEEELEAPPETDADEVEVKAQAEEGTEAEADAETDEGEIIAPTSWSKEDKELFYSLPKEAQHVLAQREHQRDSALNQKFQEVAEIRKSAEAYEQVTAPFQQLIASEGVTPQQAVGELMNGYATLRMGSPEQKLSLIATLAQANGVDLSPLMGQQEEGQSFQDPAVNQLTQRLGSVESMLHQAQMQQEHQVQSEAASELQAFMSNPEYKYANELRQDMADFVRKGDSLDVAYNKALKLNDEIQGKAAQERQESLRAKAAAEAKRKASEAKKAAGRNVRSNSVRTGTTAPMSMEETMAAAYDRATSN